MTFTQNQKLAEPISYMAEYEDGSKHLGRYSIACIIALVYRVNRS
jgi:hypothetical protein